MGLWQLPKKGWLAPCALVGLLVAGVAHADDRGTAREHFLKGSRAFDLGTYDEAIAEYGAAYRLKEDPALLYNIAQAHRLGGHTAEALRFYRVFLSRMPAAPNRVEVDAKIRDLQKVLDQQARTQQDPPTDQIRPYISTASSEPVDAPAPARREPPPVSEPSPPPAPSEPSPPAPVAPPVSAPSLVDHQPRNLKIAGIAVGAFGVAGVAAGIACGVLAQQNGDDLTALSRSGGTFDGSKESAGRSLQIVEGVMLGLGAAAVVVGVALYAVGHRQGRRALATSTAQAQRGITF